MEFVLNHFVGQLISIDVVVQGPILVLRGEDASTETREREGSNQDEASLEISSRPHCLADTAVLCHPRNELHCSDAADDAIRLCGRIRHMDPRFTTAALESRAAERFAGHDSKIMPPGLQPFASGLKSDKCCISLTASATLIIT
jgi:hypothetical protein